jgi:SWI/SNF-related matrix-associated actin-dependent regulator 1 of chromatin subfamily A
MNIAKPSSICIVCPKIATLVWERELEKFMLPELLNSFKDNEEYEVVNSGFCSGAALTIINYESLVKWVPALARREWDWIVLDEAHYIKTPNAKRSVAARTLALKAGKLVEITGSPVMNYPLELYPTISPLITAWNKIPPEDTSLIIPFEKVWPEASTESRFEHFYTWGTGNKNLRRGAHLQQKLRETFMIRRLKKEVLKDLPRKRRMIQEFEVEDENVRRLLEHEMKLFESRSKTIDDVISELVEQANISGTVGDITENDEVWEGLVDSLKYTKSYFFEEMARVRHLTAKAKLPFTISALESLLEEEDEDFHLVVFGHHVDVMEDIVEHFKGKNIKTAMISGSTPLVERQRLIDEFQDKDLRILVCGMKAVGISVTLTRASTAVFAEEDWSPAVIDQAENRIHRIGSEEHSSVLYKHFVLKDSLDAYIAKKHVYKAGQIKKMLDRPLAESTPTSKKEAAK